MKILADASLPELTTAFPAPFELTTYHSPSSLKAALPSHSILLCRSTLNVNDSLLQPVHLKILMTASSGRDHLDETFLASKNIAVFDAKGANARAVADYVLSSLAYLERHHDFHPKTAGIIGFGEVGQEVASRIQRLKCFIYDPLKSIKNSTLDTLARCDLVCLHPNLHHTEPSSSYHLINAEFLKKRPKHSAIINASRGDIVDEKALLASHQGLYCTDVFSNEPDINPDVIEHATLCTPHIAGHTIEAKADIIRLLSKRLHEHYHLTPPVFPLHPVLKGSSTYSPAVETQALKQTPTQTTFTLLRQQHQRHGFDYYYKNSL